MNHEAVLVSNPDMYKKEIERIGGMILQDCMMIENIIKKNIGKIKESPTTIFPTSCESETTISGFDMFQYFKKHELEGNKNF